jgi:glycosyltransferase involved in cell wall biosynthesis
VRMPAVHRRAMPDADVVVDVVSGMTYFSPLWQKRPAILLHTHVHTEQWEAMFPAPIAWVGQQIESRLIPRCYRDSTIVTISQSSADGLADLGVDRSHIHIIPVPATASTHDGTRSETPLFVCVGRLVPYKRVDRLLDMWRRVQPVIGGELVIVGDGPDLDALQGAAGPGVRFTGFASDDEREHLQRSAWFQVHAAAHEGWGIVITEAGLHATPTLAYRVPGVRDAIVHDVTGVLVDDDDDFVRQWIDLARSADRRESLGNGARALADRHSVDAAVAEFERIVLDAALTDERSMTS